MNLLRAVAVGRSAQDTLLMLVLAALAGAAIFIVFYGLVTPPKGKPSRKVVARPKLQVQGIQARLDKAQIEIPAAQYFKRSLMLGLPLGLALWVLIGAMALVPIGIFAGFLLTWTKLEQERDRKQINYNKQLSRVCDTIRTAYGVNPSLKKSLEAVAEYSPAPINEDFQELLLYVSQERFLEGLQQIADRRRSIVFDTVATSLIRANEATGEVGDMLQRLADSTRQNVAAFEDAMSSQINARSNVQWGTYGPWIVFCVFKGMTTMMSLGTGGNLMGGMTSFFSTFAGNIVALAAALITIFVYRYCLKLSQRGLIVRRVATSDPQAVVRLGQQPISAQQSIFSGQAKPFSTG